MIPHWALNVTSSQALVWQVPRGTVLTAGIYGSALSSKLRLILHAKSFGLTCTMWYYNDCMNAWWFEFYSVIKWMDVIFLIWLQLIYTKDSPEVLQVRQWRQNKTSYNNNIFLLVCFLDEPYNLKHQDCFLFYITLQTCLLWTFVCTFLCIFKNFDCTQILDSEDGTVIASYCGSGIPDPLMLSGSILYVRLISTSYAIGNRFRASWSTGTMLNFYS